MTPREFDSSVVQSRLALMRDLLGDLDGLGGVSAETLSSDRMLRHAVERILSQLVELAVSINSHVASTILQRGATDYRVSFDLAAQAGLSRSAFADRFRNRVGETPIAYLTRWRMMLRLIDFGPEIRSWPR